MAGSFKSNKAVFVFPSLFYRQDDFETPLDDSVIDTRHPQVDPNFAVIDRGRTPRYDCGGVDLIDEIINTELARKSFRFPATAELLTGWLGMSYGALAAPTGSPADEVQKITRSGTVSSGAFKLKLDFEGIGSSEWTESIAYDATAADVQAALNKLRSISRGGTGGGSVVCSGNLDATGMTVTFGGRLAKANISTMSIDLTNGGSGGIGGGGSLVISTVTNGTNKVHVGTRSTSDVLPYTSFIEAFIGDSTAPREWYGFAVNRILIEAAKGGDLFATVDLIGRADAFDVVGFSIPACTNDLPINTKDCRLKVNGSFVAEGLQSFRFERNNNIVTSDEAFAFDSPDLETNERGERPTETASFGVFGSRGDSLYTDAEDEVEREVIMMLGQPSERVSIIIPQGNLKLGTPPITFDGALRKSVVNVDVQPYLDNTLQASSSFEANIARTTQFLLTAP